MTEGEMVRYHHQRLGHEFEQTPGDSGRQRNLMGCCGPWGRKDPDTTERLDEFEQELLHSLVCFTVTVSTKTF